MAIRRYSEDAALVDYILQENKLLNVGDAFIIFMRDWLLHLKL